MSAIFKKGWYLGKPLKELQPNTKYFQFWYLGKVFHVFDKPAIPTVPITVQISEVLHLASSISLYVPAIEYGRIVPISSLQSLTFNTFDPSSRAGITDGANVFGSGAEVLYTPASKVDVYGVGAEVLYAPSTTGYVSNVLVQVEIVETIVQVDQAGIAVIYTEPARVQIDQAGIVVVATQDGLFTVNKQSFTLSIHDPNIIAIQIRECDLTHLTLTSHAPFIVIHYSVTAQPLRKSLKFGLFAPLVKQGCRGLPELQSLNLNLQSVLALIGACVSETLEASLELNSPTIYYSSKLVVSKLSSVLAFHAPTINHNAAALPPVQSLTLAVYTPFMRSGANIDETLSLTLHQESAPTVLWGWTAKISTPFHLVLHQYVVTVRAIKNALGQATIQSLVLTSRDVEVLFGASIKETLSLVLSKSTPEIHNNSLIFIEILHLTLNQLAPVVHIKTTNLVSILSLVLNQFDVRVIIGYVIKETPLLTLHEFDVTINYSSTLIVDAQSLNLTLYDPESIAEPFEPYDIDPLHKERQWGSSYSLGHGEYASRAGSALSSNFPLVITDIDKQITVCCWLRLKSASGYRAIFTKLLSNSVKTISLALSMVNSQLFLQWSAGQFPGLDFDVYLDLNKWYHIGLSIDGINKTVYLHAWDDKAQMTICRKWYPACHPYPQTVLSVGSGNFVIGYQDGGSMGEMWLDGYVDEFVVFNKLKSPHEIDQIRLGQFNGPLSGYGVSDFGLTTAYAPQGKITVADAGASVGYSPAGKITIADYGLTVAYKVPMPPSPSRFPVISGFPSPGSGTGNYVFTNLTYKFKSDVSAFDYGASFEARASQFTLPNRELETMIGIADESAYLRLSETLVAGATIYSVPIWAFRTVLDSNAHAGDLEFVANEVSNLYVGEKALLVRANDASIYDLCDITSIAGHTVNVETALTLHHHKFQMPTSEVAYDTRSCYVVPCITGIVDAQDIEVRGNAPTFWLKVKVNGGAWINAGQSEVSNFVQAPAEAGFISPKIERTLVGTENGLIELMTHLPSRLAFHTEWYFKDSSWKDLRDLFIAAKGKTATIPMPTWCFELRVKSHRNAGSLTIELTPGFSNIWNRFKRLYVYPITGAAPFVITLTGYIGSNTFSCSELASELYPGDKVSLYPDVRFMEDELVFEFIYFNECKVKTSFIEVLD